MSNESKFGDYEPFTHPSGSRNEVLAPEESWRPVKLAQASQPFHMSSAQRIPASETDSHKLAKIRKEQNIKITESFDGQLKRGHSLSFLGLMLFTAVLYVRPYELFPSLAWTRGMAFWIAIVTIVIYIPTQLEVYGKLTIRPPEVNCALLLFLFALLSTPFATDRETSWLTTIEYLKVVLMFIVLVNVVRTERRLKLLFLLALVVSCVMSVAAINDYRSVNLGSNNQRIKGIIGGMFDNPNDLALHLVTLIPIAVSLMFASRAGVKKLFYAGCAIVMAAGVVVTFSRAGFLGFACMSGVLTWRIARRHKWIVLLAPLIIVAFVALAPTGYGSRLGTTSDGSAVNRTDDLKRSILVAIRHPLLGVGIGNYVHFSNRAHATHNAYTQVASEMGILAMLAYILFQVSPIRELRKIVREAPATSVKSRHYYLAVGLEASLTGYMVTSFFASVAFLWYVYYLVGYAVCLRRLHEASKPPVVCYTGGAAGTDKGA